MITLGGTIASTQAVTGGVAPSLSGHELLQAVPQLILVADLDTAALKNVPSTDITVDDVITLATAIRDAFAHGVQGVVVTQGTDTLEETAFALDLLLDTANPIVVTGAMRAADEPGADGPANLLAAVQVAASPDAARTGVLIVAADEIHAARYVRKFHATRVAAFASPGRGPIGIVVEGRPRFFWNPMNTSHIDLNLLIDRQVRVGIVPTFMGDDGSLLRSAARAGFNALVLEASGAGHVSSAVAAASSEVISGMPLVLVTRVISGPILQSTYSYPGSESDLIRRGLIPGGALDALKARLLLTLLLMAGAARTSIQDAFAQFLAIR